MSTISKSKLKTNMLRIFREIESGGEEVAVTDRNRAVLGIQPIARKRTVEEVFDDVSGNVVYHADVNAPTADEWREA